MSYAEYLYEVEAAEADKLQRIADEIRDQIKTGDNYRDKWFMIWIEAHYPELIDEFIDQASREIYIENIGPLRVL